MALNFISATGIPFKLYCSLKRGPYLVTGSGFKLRLIINRPELHSYVTFHAKDPAGKANILLNGKPSISEPVVYGNPDFVNVLVTLENGM